MQLNLFRLVMLTMGFIISLRSLPILAETGWQQAFYLLIASIFFLLPVALISAELSTGWPRAGGVYQWVKLALGDRMAFIAAWMLWVQMFFGMVTIGSFIAAMIAYIINPALVNNHFYMAGVIIALYWVVTLLNLKGVRSASLISSIGFFIGVLLPFVMITGFGLAFYMGNQSTALPPFSWHKLLPDITNIDQLSFIVGVIFTFTGIEVSSVHAKNVKNPQRNYPLSLLITIVLLMVINIFGAFSIEMAEPRNQLNLASGVMQTFSRFFQSEGIPWMIPVVAFMTAIGAFGQLSTWVLGPSKAMHQVAVDGFMPVWWHKTNENGVPVRFVFVQASMISLIAMLYVVVPAVNQVFFMVLILATILYSITYLLLFISGIVLRYKYPDVERTYRVPGNLIGMWVLAGFGSITVLFAIFISFFPPSSLHIETLFYSSFMGGGLLVFIAIPLLLYRCRKPEWKDTPAKNTM
ncbi:amino acid permease [Desulforhopalus vacuolatus]|uniref:amino acid permease n=1 Tax=Desulforhopalus vacuolatus TaxID=40414 RepID=UPI00196396A3|nr:amino acid permease [Desulforhopalus vacuolatus]MBM9520488.1 amino acid permease [Desulforhopalus vacuolatus]